MGTAAFFAVFTITAIVSEILISCYISVLYVITQVATKIISYFVTSRSAAVPDLELMLRSLDWYNRLMQATNDDIGILPFCVLGMEFVIFSCRISLIIVSSDEQLISPTFAALTVGSCNLLYLFLASQMMEASTAINNLRTYSCSLPESR